MTFSKRDLLYEWFSYLYVQCLLFQSAFHFKVFSSLLKKLWSLSHIHYERR